MASFMVNLNALEPLSQHYSLSYNPTTNYTLMALLHYSEMPNSSQTATKIQRHTMKIKKYIYMDTVMPLSSLSS